MLPLNSLSDEPILADFLFPDNKAFNTREDWDMGGIAHQDPSQGLLVQPWRCWWEGGAIWIEPQLHRTGPIKVLETVGATYVSLAFDRAMRVTVAWMWQGYMYLYWYDTYIQGYTTSTFAGNCPRLTHDDKRAIALNWSDVLFFYLYQNNLCVRNQRDRYSVEHVLSGVDPKLALTRVGMTTNGRVRVEALQRSIAW